MKLVDFTRKCYSTEERDPPRPWTDVHLPLLMSLIKSKRIKLLDVRTAEETEQTGMMPGATNIPCMWFNSFFIILLENLLKIWERDDSLQRRKFTFIVCWIFGFCQKWVETFANVTKVVFLVFQRSHKCL